MFIFNKPFKEFSLQKKNDIFKEARCSFFRLRVVVLKIKIT